MDAEEIKNFNPDVVLDVKMTLLSNMIYFVFAALYGVFLIKAFDMIARLSNEDTKILAFIVFMFAFIKITSGWHNFNLEYKVKGT